MASPPKPDTRTATKPKPDADKPTLTERVERIEAALRSGDPLVSAAMLND